MTSKVIEVRAEHMQPPDDAHPCTNCMVARALKDAGFTDVSVGIIYATAKEIRDPASLPFGVGDQINRYLDGLKVEPFTFTLSYEPRGAK